MEHTGVVLVKEAGKDVPEVVLQSALLHHSVMFSVSLAEQIEGRPRVSTLIVKLKDTKHEKGALGEVEDVLKVLTDQKLVMCFSSQDGDPQPFTLLVNNKAEPQLVVFMDGDFEEKGRQTDGHTHEYTEANDYITTKILELSERCDHDIPKLVTHLQTPNVSKELGKTGKGDHNVLIMMASNGQVPSFHRPDHKLIKYDWGVASNDLELKSETKPVPETPAKPASLFDRVKTTTAAVVAAIPGQSTTTSTKKSFAELKAEKDAAKATTVGATATVIPATATAGGSAVSVDAKWRVCKVPTDSNFNLKDKRKFLKRRLGANTELPEGWERMTEVVVDIDVLMDIYPKSTKAELEKKYPQATAAGALASIPAKIETKMETKVEPAHTQPDKATPQPEDQPVHIPPEHIKNIENRFMSQKRTIALLGRDGKNIMDPTLTAKMEDKLPEFWEGVKGIPNLESTFHFDTKTYHEMGSCSLNMLATAAANYKNHLIKARQRVHLLEEAAKTGKPVADTTPAAAPLSKFEQMKLDRQALKKAM